MSEKISVDAQALVTLNDGHVMPQLGLGVWRTPPAETARVVRLAVELGYRSVDTARHYENEDGVGEGLEGHPEVFVTTKLWNAEQGYDRALKAFDESARLLRRPIPDLFLLHWPMPTPGQHVETRQARAQVKQDGRGHSVGV